MNISNKLNALNKLNKRNELDKRNKLNGLNKLNKLNKLNELNESNKWNRSSNLNKLTATIPGPLLCFLNTATSFRGLQTFAGPRGQQSIFGWLSGPAINIWLARRASHRSCASGGRPWFAISVYRKRSNGPGIGCG